MRRALAAALLAIAAGGVPASISGKTGPEDFRRDFTALQALDARVHAIGWKLRSGNAAFCPDTIHDTGLLLQDAGAYSKAAMLRRQFSLEGDIFVQATAPGSPASRILSPLDVIEVVGGQAMRDLPWSKDEPWKRLLDVEASLEASAADGRPFPILVAGRAGINQLDTTPACRTRFEVVSAGDDIGADGERVRVARGFIGLGYVEDELAAAMAHELAHNILRHPQWLSAHGRKRRDVRETEREADRMMPWLLANAGYDPQAAVRFMQRWGPKNDGGLLRKRTHDGWDERVDIIAAELPLIRAAMAGGGEADWTQRFVPRPIG